MCVCVRVWRCYLARPPAWASPQPLSPSLRLLQERERGREKEREEKEEGRRDQQRDTEASGLLFVGTKRIGLAPLTAELLMCTAQHCRAAAGESPSKAKARGEEEEEEQKEIKGELSRHRPSAVQGSDVCAAMGLSLRLRSSVRSAAVDR